jgi:pimeloyl-ACP methyl ester carboxylesterase
MTDDLQFLRRPGKPALAYRQQQGKGPKNRVGLLWLGGYASDMLGTKAEFLSGWAQEHDRAFTRFDYRGHGQSEGNFEDGTIGLWAEDALAMLDDKTDGKQILIGSSMGAWIACLLARQRAERLAGIVLIAPAPDFTNELIPHQWEASRFAELEQKGRVEIPSDYDDSVMVYTKALFDDGKKQSILNAPLSVPCPVHILSGMKDEVVPWQHVMRLAEHIDALRVSVHLEKDSDHRFSGEHELALIGDAILGIA